MRTLLIIPVLLTTLGTMSGVVAQACVTPPSGMVGWWPGDLNANDIADANNNGALNGDIDFIGTGMVDEAFTINAPGPGYVQIPNSSPLLEPSNVTVDAWVRADGTPGRFRYILAKGAKGCLAASYGLYTGFDSGLQFYVFDGTTTFVVSPAATAAEVWDGSWHHVAGTYDGANVRLYLDGIEVGGGTPTSIAIGYGLSTDNDLVIGNYLDNGACLSPTPFSFIGEIDEVELFNVALSAADIGAIYNAGSAGKCKAIQVAIDIKPGSDPNCFNINGNGVIPVAVLGAADFDVAEIDLASLSFGGLEVRVRGNKGPLCSVEYSNDDPYLDLVCHFEDDSGSWESGDAEATLTGNLFDGTSIEGSDSICITP